MWPNTTELTTIGLSSAGYNFISITVNVTGRGLISSVEYFLNGDTSVIQSVEFLIVDTDLTVHNLSDVKQYTIVPARPLQSVTVRLYKQLGYENEEIRVGIRVYGCNATTTTTKTTTATTKTTATTRTTGTTTYTTPTTTATTTKTTTATTTPTTRTTATTTYTTPTTTATTTKTTTATTTPTTRTTATTTPTTKTTVTTTPTTKTTVTTRTSATTTYTTPTTSATTTKTTTATTTPTTRTTATTTYTTPTTTATTTKTTTATTTPTTRSTATTTATTTPTTKTTVTTRTTATTATTTPVTTTPTSRTTVTTTVSTVSTPSTKTTRSTATTTSSFSSSATTTSPYCECGGIRYQPGEIIPSNRSCDYRICYNGVIVPIFSCSSWSHWSECGCVCNRDERKERHRNCFFTNGYIEGLHLNLTCSEHQAELCFPDECPEDCVLSPWSSWSNCSDSCSEQYSVRTRTVIKASHYGGKHCGSLKESRVCPQPSQCSCTGEGMYYSNCSNQCPSACSHLASFAGVAYDTCVMQRDCLPGCACRAPLVLQDGKCVQRSECRCVYDANELTRESSSIPVSTLLTTLSTGGEIATVSPVQNLEPHSWIVVGCYNCSCTEGRTVCQGGACSTTSSVSYPSCTPWSQWSPCEFSIGQNKSIQTRRRNCGVLVEETRTCFEPVCRVNMQQIRSALGEPGSAVIAIWIEKDGTPGLTRADELVNEQDVVSPKTVISFRCGELTCTDGVFVAKRTPACDNDCQWGPWNEGVCSATCGSGYRNRSRSIVQPATGDGKPCEPNGGVETVPCAMSPCPCAWTSWSNWSDCSQPCGGGLRSRSRFPVDASNPLCGADGRTEIASCNVAPCPSGQAVCSSNKIDRTCYNVTCPNTCSSLQSNSLCTEKYECVDGCFCPDGLVENEDGKCVSPSDCVCDMNSKQCNLCEVKACVNGEVQCQPTENCDCQYAEWQEWSLCSKSCGGGLQYRTREKLVDKRGNGKPCVGDCTQSRPCATTECPRCQDEFNVTYAVGSTMPSNNCCKHCFCSQMLQKECVERPESDEEKPQAEWSNWTPWSTCSATCTGGSQRRTRTCIDLCSPTAPRCQGGSSETRDCGQGSCSPVQCLLGEWKEVTTCTARCSQSGTAKTATGVIQQEAVVVEAAKYGGTCNTTRSRPCQIPCDVDCQVKSWSTSKCVKECPTSVPNCDTTCGVGVQVSTPFEYVEAANNGQPCSEMERREPCYMPKNCSASCLPPMTNVQKNRCLARCVDLAFADSCSETVATPQPMCTCPGNAVEQDGSCVDTSQCRCTWNSNILGPRPSNVSLEVSAGYSVAQDCNTCTCTNGQWSCTEKACRRDCQWGDWYQVAPCNTTCGRGEQIFQRDVVQPAEFGGQDCQGLSSKSVPCWPKSQPCCDPNSQLTGRQCQKTCSMVLGNTSPSFHCTEGCRCKAGYALNEYTGLCVSEDDCRKCNVNGTVYSDNTAVPDTETCVVRKCQNGVYSEKALPLDKLCACSPSDHEIFRRGGERMKHPTRCCYEATERPCRPERRRWNSVVVENSVCEFLENVTWSVCVGACPSSASIDDGEFAPQVVKSGSASSNVEVSQRTSVSIRSDCTCCMPQQAIKLPRRVFSCKDGRSVSVTPVEVTKCGCSSKCSDGLRQMPSSGIFGA